ncbi:hypothetical protein BH09BAC1_BH09BAC1_13000 [soil metagenome]
MLLACFIFSPSQTSAQGTTATFGQNRVQYKNFEWSFFDSEHFTTYFYLGGQDIGKYTIIYAEKTLESLEAKMEFRVNSPIEILVYNDISDLNQTNIGIGTEVNNPGGFTKIIANKMFIYFDGNHENLEIQIRRGIAQIMIQHMIFGTNFQEVLQNAVMLSLPEWFTYGLASYMGEDWSTLKDERLREGILSGRLKKLNKLNPADKRFVGQALWHYVDEKYGAAAVPNLIYLTRINRSLESGFLFVLGGSVDAVYKEWYETMYARYTGAEAIRDAPEEGGFVARRKVWPKRETYQLKLSKDGKKVAFVSNIQGKYRVHVQDVSQTKSKRVMKGGIKTTTLVTDYGNPMLAWSPDNTTLCIIYERRDKVKMILYNSETGKKDKRDITKFQQIHDFQFTNNPQVLVMSAVNRGQSDIYLYNLPNTTTTQLTDDYYDDLYPAYVEASGRTGVIFSSNRSNDTLKPQAFDTTLLSTNFDLFFYALDVQDKVLGRVTYTEFADERQAMQYNDSLYTFLSNKNGISNRYIGYLDNIFLRNDTMVFFADSIITNPTWSLSALQAQPNNRIDSVVVKPVYRLVGVTYPNTNYNASILEQDVAAKVGKSAQLFRKKGRYQFHLTTLDAAPEKNSAPKLKNTEYMDWLMQREDAKRKAVESQKKPKIGTTGVVNNNIDNNVDAAATDTTPPPPPFFQNNFNTAPATAVEGYYGEIGFNPDGTPDGTVGNFAPVPIFQFTKVLPYRVKFSQDYVLTQVDNSLIMTRYQQYTPGQPVFQNPDLSGTINIGISDLMEDHKISGGFRFPFNFQGSEYFIAYENLKKRIDKKIMYYRRVDKQSYSNDQTLPFINVQAPAGRPANLPIEAKQKTNYFEAKFSYPIDVTKSIRWALAYRNDNYVYLSNDRFTLELPNHNENWLFARLEYVEDHTVKVAQNLYNGVRFKVWGEIHKQFTIEPDTIFSTIKLKLPNFDNSYFGVVAADFRYYQKIHKTLTWCNRIAVGHSYGTRPLLYYLGGVDSWIAPRFDQTTKVNQDINWAYQTVVTNMRGFSQNVRNGNSYAVLNSEIRWPIFQYLLKKNIRSDFVKNFMIVGFTDIGSAWIGINPFDDENPQFSETIGQSPVIVKVDYYRNPLVVGYGFGMRSTILGYYLRFDVAWGSDSGQKLGPQYYFSLTTDF